MIGAERCLTVRVGCEVEYESDAQTPAVVIVRPNDAAHRLVDESWETSPAVAWHDYHDLYNNRPRRLTLPRGAFALRYDARVEISPEPDATDWNAKQHPVAELPDDVLLYTMASRYCLSDELLADAWELFGGHRSGWHCVQAICDWVHENITFRYGTSWPVTTALDVYRSRTGVCRDFAHLAITFCRALSIPARYAFGYLPDIGVPPPNAPMDFCAWFEAYLGGQWWTFDPRNNQRRIGHIVVARGRDAVDVAMVTTYGNATLKRMTVWADPV